MMEPREAARLVRALGTAMRAVGAKYAKLDGLELWLGDDPAPADTHPEETKQIPLPLEPPKPEKKSDEQPLTLEDLLFAASAG